MEGVILVAGCFFALAFFRSDAGATMRQRYPQRDIRLHRFQTPHQPLGRRVVRRLARLPLLMPLCAGIIAAGAIDAVLPESIGDDVVVDAALADIAEDVGERDSAVPAAADSVVANADRVVAPEAPVVEARPSLPTRDAALEADINRLLQNGKTPMSAVVVMEAATGRVVAIAEHAASSSTPSEGLAFSPMAPAASVFKVVTASALLEAGVKADQKVCYHGGKTRMKPSQLKDSKRDGRCVTFADVLPYSTNVAVAKLASAHLQPAQLRQSAARWGFGSTLGVDGLTPSVANIPDDTFPFAEAAAGFGDVKISAMHGAVMASVVANGGRFVTPVFDATHTPRSERVISARHAEALRTMLTDTVSVGTGRRAFQQGPKLGQKAAGKTGSLTDYKTGLDTSWFVGFAPADEPEFIVAAVVVNTGIWHIKAPWLAKEALRLTFRSQAKKGDRVASR